MGRCMPEKFVTFCKRIYESAFVIVKCKKMEKYVARYSSIVYIRHYKIQIECDMIG